MGTRINGRLTALPVCEGSDWFVTRRHCARATYKHKTTQDKSQPRERPVRTMTRAQREAEYAATLPADMSDGAYMAAMQAKFGGEHTNPQDDMFDGD